MLTDNGKYDKSLYEACVATMVMSSDVGDVALVMVVWVGSTIIYGKVGVVCFEFVG
jgi:hypothetical protein